MTAAPLGAQMLSSLGVSGFCLLLAAAAWLSVLLPPSSSAGVTRKESMWGLAVVDGVSQFPICADLGVGIWQSRLSWDQVAARRPARPADPGDPAYTWPRALCQLADVRGDRARAVARAAATAPGATSSGLTRGRVVRLSPRERITSHSSSTH